jgi:hypothetical protein
MNSFLMLTFTFTFSINWVFSEFLYESRRLNLILDFQLAEITGREDTLIKNFIPGDIISPNQYQSISLNGN